MSFVKGAPRPERAGRKKGSLNKSTEELHRIAEKLKCDPFEVLILFANGDYERLGYEKVTLKGSGDNVWDELTISPELRQKSARDACEYLYSKRKAVDHTFTDPRQLPDDELIKETAKMLAALGSQE